MTHALRERGYDAVSVRGGTEAWASTGHDVVTGAHA